VHDTVHSVINTRVQSLVEYDMKGRCFVQLLDRKGLGLEMNEIIAKAH